MVFRERKRHEEKEESRRRVEEREESSRRRGEDQGEAFKCILVFSSILHHYKMNLESQNTYFLGYLSNIATRFQKFHFLSNMANLFNLEVPFLSDI